MRQNAVVIETNGTRARVRVLRTAMCEGCAQRGSGESCACGNLMGVNREMIVEAANDIGAKVGDDVVLETASQTVLSDAAIVFLLPMVAFFLLYTVVERVSSVQALPWVAGAVGFVLAFIPAIVRDRIRKKRSPQIHITARKQEINKESEETE